MYEQELEEVGQQNKFCNRCYHSEKLHKRISRNNVECRLCPDQVRGKLTRTKRGLN